MYKYVQNDKITNGTKCTKMYKWGGGGGVEMEGEFSFPAVTGLQ